MKSETGWPSGYYARLRVERTGSLCFAHGQDTSLAVCHSIRVNKRVRVNLKGLCHDCLIQFGNNANCASLFSGEFEKVLENYKITAFDVKQICLPSSISNVGNNKNEQ